LLRQQLRADLRLDIGGHLRVLDQELARVLLALADPVAVVAVPGARFLDDVLAHAEIDDLALARDAVAVQDLELARAERRRDLVLHDLHAGLVAEHLVALLDRADAANVEPHGRIELQRVAARRRLRAAEHHADLHADLVDEDHEAVRALDVRRELAQRLRFAVSLRSADASSRAGRPTCESPISPSISALGVSAATESTMITSTAPERTSMSVISSACSPVSGCEIKRSSTFTPTFCA